MYEVESIANKRVNPQTNTTEYLVKWCGYSEAESTWEPQKKLIFVKELINKFNQKSDIKANCLVTNENQTQSQVKRTKLNPSDDENQNLLIFQQQDSIENQQKGKNQDEQIKKQQIIPNQIQKQRDKSEKSVTQQIVQNKNNKEIDEEKEKIKNKLMNKLCLREVQCKAKEILPNNIQMLNKMNKKMPPPLPPDFSINKQKYNQALLQKSKQLESLQLNTLNKHKMIHKQKVEGQNKNRLKQQNKKYYEKSQFQNQFGNGFSSSDNQNMNEKEHFRPFERIVPPPPPPRMARIQKQYLKNRVNSEISLQNPNYYQSRQTKWHQKSYGSGAQLREKSKAKNYAREQNAYHRYAVQRTRGQQYNLIVYEVKGMHRVGDSFIYVVQTNQGELQLGRKEMVPRFSTQLVQFYERYLVLQD